MHIKYKLRPHFIIWLMLFFSVSGCDNDKNQPADSIIESNARVKFKILNTRFDIPAKYFQGGAHTRSNVLETAHLWALLPNFEGYDKSLNHHDFVEVYHQGRRIKVMLITRGRRMTVPQIVVKRNARERLSVLGGRHQGGKYDEMRYGLEYYHSDFNGQDSRYLYRENDRPSVLLRCAEDPKIPYPGCILLWDYNDEIAIRATFATKYLPQWHEIWINIQKLLDGELDCCRSKAQVIHKDI